MQPSMKMWALTACIALSGGMNALNVQAAPDNKEHGEHSAEHDIDPMNMTNKPGNMNARTEKRLTALHAGLKLRLEQEPAFSEFKDSLLTQAAKTQSRRQEMRANMSRGTAIERLEQMKKMGGERLASLDNVIDSVKRFYATLDSEQKTFFDKSFTLMRKGEAGSRHKAKHLQI